MTDYFLLKCAEGAIKAFSVPKNKWKFLITIDDRTIYLDKIPKVIPAHVLGNTRVLTPNNTTAHIFIAGTLTNTINTSMFGNVFEFKGQYHFL